MDDLLSRNSLGGGSLAGRATETLMEKQLDESSCPSMSLRMRGVCFAVCMTFGFLLEILSVIALGKSGNLIHFLVPFIMALTLLVGGSFFLMSPKAQYAKAFEPERRIATIVFLVMTAVVLIVALAIQIVILTMILALGHFGVYIWYMTVQIPYAKKFCCCCFSRCKGTE